MAYLLSAQWCPPPSTAADTLWLLCDSYDTGILYSALPTIKAYRDGRVWIQRADGSTLIKRIAVDALSRLLEKLDNLGFYRITSSSVKASMRQPPKITKTPDGQVEVSTEVLIITDLATTTISVRRDGRFHTVSCYGAEEFAEHYPRATDLNILKNTIAEIYSEVGESSNHCSQPPSVLMTSFHLTSTLRSAAKLARATGDRALSR